MISRSCPVFLFVFIALGGCSAADEAAHADAAPAVEPERIRITPRIVVAPDLAMQGVAAVELWSAATVDAYAPDLAIGPCGQGEDLCLRVVDERRDCGRHGRDWLACFTGGAEIQIWAGVRDEWRLSIIAHELGHSLGLEHDHAGVMMPGRDLTRACVEAADVAQLEVSTGVVGVPACVR
jgi:hypothetical protein